MNATLEELARKAAAVAEQRRIQDEAVEKERRARVELLDAIVASVKPAMRALSSLVTLYDVADEPTGEFHGVELVVDGTDKLFLRADATWVHGYTESSHGLTFWRYEVRTSGDVLQLGFDINQIARRLSELLDQQLTGNAGSRIESANEKAEKLRAVTTLFKGEKKPKRQRIGATPGRRPGNIGPGAGEARVKPALVRGKRSR